MSIFRRRLMMQSKAQPFECPYITDGLVFWLDGINKGASDGSWVDLVKRIKFTNSNVEPSDDGWLFNGTSSYFTTSSQIGYGADYTFEFCIKFTGSVNRIVIMAFGPQTIKYSPMVYVQTGSYFIIMQNTNKYNFTPSLNTNYSISANLSRLVRNGVSISPSSTADYWNNSGNYIGRRASGNYFKGLIHGIRMYNRRLSLEEQQFNISVDNERFNLGLTL